MSGTATTQMLVLAALPRKGTITLDALERLVGVDRRYVVNSVGRLILRDYAARHENGVYKITQGGRKFLASGEELKSGSKGKRLGVRKNNKTGLRQRLWNAMRQTAGFEGRGSFSLPDILLLALNKDEAGSRTYDNAQKYMSALKKTGYLLTINRRQPGSRPGSNGFSVYRLQRDSGEQCPIHRMRKKAVYDPNTHEVFPC